MSDRALVGMDDDADIGGSQLRNQPTARRVNLTDGLGADCQDDLVEIFRPVRVGGAVEDGDGETLRLTLDSLDHCVESDAQPSTQPALDFCHVWHRTVRSALGAALIIRNVESREFPKLFVGAGCYA